ncbi:Multi antimicrobial extrusion protein [Dillenia turbinata]|uniref:Protein DETOXIFICATION n=1 Tax=Dillenia turbinata TaxID=194707 RepID=A0AAN8YVD7_9MAGN
MEEESAMEAKSPELTRWVTARLSRKRIGEKWKEESKKMWQIAAPAILTSVTQFSIGFVTSAFVGHIGDVELAAVSVVQNVIEGFVFGFMLGMGSALETLCGQAVGAGRFNMLGIYMQRSWIITFVTALCLTPVYVFTSPLLKLLRQDKSISDVAAKYSIYVIPQLFAYAINFPIQKFLQSQSKVWIMTIISVVALAIHVVLNWVLVILLREGMLGAAMAGNISWWIIILAQIVYIIAGYFPESWTGFSLQAFKSLTAFVKLSLASAVMLCLELWYWTGVILMVGYLKNPEIEVDAISICARIHMVASINLPCSLIWQHEFAALDIDGGSWFQCCSECADKIVVTSEVYILVRVSNELGAGQPNAAKFSVVVSVMTSVLFGVIFTVVVLATKHNFPRMFTGRPRLIGETLKLEYFLAASIFLNSVQPVLNGVAVGAGWQFLVALINIGCYYIFGLPIGALLGYVFDLRVQGIWSGMIVGVLLQTVILLAILFRTNWHKEVVQAEKRMRTWGGPCSPQLSSKGSTPDRTSKGSTPDRRSTAA